MSDEVTRQMREEREDAVDAFQIAFERLQRLGIEHPEPMKRKPTLTEKVDEHCCGIASDNRTISEIRPGYIMECQSFSLRKDPDFDPQLAINEFRACKQDPAFSAWATKWAVKLCRALGAE